MNILIVDDSIVVRKMVASFLDPASGFTYEFAENGQVALDKINTKNNFDVLFLDWNMPELGGEGFLEQKPEMGNCKIIMMTTEKNEKIINRSIELGADEYIMKPFTKEIILGKIEMVQAA